MNEPQQPGIPINVREVIQQSLERVEKLFDVYLQFIRRGVAVDGIGSAEVNNRVFDYANHNVATAFKFARKLTRAQDAQQLASLQSEFVQAQMRAMAEQSRGLSEIAAKALMENSKTFTMKDPLSSAFSGQVRHQKCLDTGA